MSANREFLPAAAGAIVVPRFLFIAFVGLGGLLAAARLSGLSDARGTSRPGAAGRGAQRGGLRLGVGHAAQGRDEFDVRAGIAEAFPWESWAWISAN
jgi:hypothetical protein